ncbi:ribosome maturation factor RimM [Bombilactobacillus folatiphilus]|uniref:Ribosome maturation factor RimM n=1 Tax=Bombilactobacillus folatiphilus TaxID=2923362 RepID=A0ABY4P7L2_9LACO|nr:ribosome maturation factor RimM [Bombilactobacillus folatiphilus]UQS81600.1 ribosome maturation factor RimM [Bombilactobacillus folatiphilus]
MEKPAYLKVGKIVNTHGLKGELKVQPLTDFAEQRFVRGKTLFVQNQEVYQAVTVQSARKHQNFLLVQFAEILDIDVAQTFKNHDLWISVQQLPTLPEGQYYYKDIMGIQVLDQQRGLLGTVSDIWDLGPNDVWTVQGNKYGEILIPILSDVLLGVDLSTQQARVRLPEGLIDEN